MRRHDYDEEEDVYQETPQQKTLLPAIHLSGLDWLLAVLLGGIVFAGLTVFSFPGLCPDVWNDAAVAAGLRPPETIFPGLWRLLAGAFYKMLGVAGGAAFLQWAGRLAAALLVGVGYVFMRSFLLLLVRGRLRYAAYREVVLRVAPALAALFFVCSDSVWRAGQALTPAGLLTLLSLVSATLFLAFLLNGRLWNAYWALFLAGLLAAETPMGFLLLAAEITAMFMALRRASVSENCPLLDPIVAQSSKWYMTFFFSIGLIAGIALNCWSFASLDGLNAIDAKAGDVPLLYAVHYWSLITHAATGLGWALGLAMCLLPCIVATVMLPQATDEEQFLPYHVGAVFFVTGLMSFSQLALLSPLWFWTWSEMARVDSPYLIQLFMLFAAITVACAIVVLGTDACCRNHTRLAMQRFAELREDDEVVDGKAPYSRGGTHGGLIVFLVVGVLLVAGVVPGRYLGKTRQMLAIIDDYAREVVAECGSAKWLFTDGSFDTQIEHEAAVQGKKIRALSMMADNTPYNQFIRQENVTDLEDRMSLAQGAPMTLRSWMHDKPDRMKDAALQLGFELWKRNGLELPLCSGVLARPLGMSAEECAAGIARAKELADRILQLYVEGGLEKSAGHRIRELFLFVQWRISRLARMRAEKADRAGQTDAALADVKLSDQLDNSNASIQKILKAMERARATTLKQVTPREGLQMALARADFVLARRYAEPILDADPDDPNANFGMGMSYYTQKQYTRAEEYLKRCLVRKPKEPAVWNNLAMIAMYAKKFDEAVAHAQKALELIPDSAEVKDTLKQIEEARKKAAEESASANTKEEKK